MMKASIKTRLPWARVLAGATVLGIVALMFAACDKYNLPTDLPKPDYSAGGLDTSYVEVSPEWTAADGISFNHPSDIVLGYDQYLYICDTGNDRVLKLTLDGTLVENYAIVHPVAITQDRGLDLLVVSGDYRTTANGGRDTTLYGNAVYRRKFVGRGEFKAVWRAESPYTSTDVHGQTFWEEAEFWGIAASETPEKDYFLCDFLKHRVLRFNSSDQPVSPPLVNEGLALGLTQYPCDLFTYQIAGQGYIALAQGAGNFGVQVFSPVNGKPFFSDTTAVPDLVRFTNRNFKDVAVDEFSNFYILVQDPDSLLHTNSYFYKFDRTGHQILAFGTTGSGTKQFSKPQGIAYKSGVIYIADTGNNRIVRYQLSTDFQQ